MRFSEYITPYNLRKIFEDNPQITRVETISVSEKSPRKLLSNIYRDVKKDGKVCKHFTYTPNKIGLFSIGNHTSYQQNKEYYAPLIEEVISAISCLNQLKTLDFSKFYLGTGIFGTVALSNIPWFGIDFLEAVDRLSLKTLKLNHLEGVSGKDLTPFFQKNKNLRNLEFSQIDEYKYRFKMPSLPELISLSLRKLFVGKPVILSILKCTSLKYLDLPSCTFIASHNENSPESNLLTHPHLEKIDFSTTIEVQGGDFFNYVGKGLKNNKVLKELIFSEGLKNSSPLITFLALVKDQNPNLKITFKINTESA